MEVTGKIKEIFPEKQVSASFRKRELVITTQEQYPQHLIIEFVQDKGDLLNNFAQGQDVKVSINLRGREWTAPDGQVKYFNSIHGWRIEPLSAEPVGSQPESNQSAGYTNSPPSNLPPLDTPASGGGDDDDLPF
ncbi:MAG: DUF3127 domain-containing protein [Cryomorphaceae bacterium]|nr:DUF3127 domain-containing protein [Cryomorphaceae bacterium]